MSRENFNILGHIVLPGTVEHINLPIPSKYSYLPAHMPLYVAHGKKNGKVILITSTIHGDEINGIEIIRRLFKSQHIKDLAGTIIAMPVINIYGFEGLSRYFPDRRDLNRSFPGSKTGSLAARIANLLNKSVLPLVDCVIDLHTAAVHRKNFPHIRIDIEDKASLGLAKAFNAPLILDSSYREGSFRKAAVQAGIPVLLYEAGEALRFDEIAIRYGVKGILNVLQKMKIIKNVAQNQATKTQIAKSSSWVRANESGMIYLKKQLGQQIQEGELLGYIYDVFADKRIPLKSTSSGIIIGKIRLPMVNQGDAVLHLAHLKQGVDIVPQFGDKIEMDYLVE